MDQVICVFTLQSPQNVIVYSSDSRGLSGKLTSVKHIINVIDNQAFESEKPFFIVDLTVVNITALYFK